MEQCERNGTKNDCIQRDIGEDWSQRDSFSQTDEEDKKRKFGVSDFPRSHKVRVIVPNPQLNAGNNTDPSIIFRPWKDKNQSMGNQWGAGNGGGP